MYAVCVASCRYCGVVSRPIIETDDRGGFVCEIECGTCGGRKTGHVRVCVGFEPTEETARARAESLTVDTIH